MGGILKRLYTKDWRRLLGIIANINPTIGNAVSNIIANSAVVDPSVILGDSITVMDYAIVRANVTIDDGSVIGPHCVIGEYQDGFYNASKSYQNPPTKIGHGAVIRSHSIIYSGTVLGKEFRSGHHIVIRENSLFGNHCLFGNFCQTDEAVLVGDYVRCHSKVFLAGRMEIGAFSCLYPNVTTNDVRYPPYRNGVSAPKIGKRAVIGSGTLLLSGVSIGDGVFIAAGSLVSHDIPAGMFAISRPAKVKKPVTEIRLKGFEIEQPYPFDLEILRNREPK